MGQAGRSTSHYLPHRFYPAFPCVTPHYRLALLCLSFSILLREIMHRISFRVYPTSHEERPTKTLEPMRSALPNTDQPRIPPLGLPLHTRQQESPLFRRFLGFFIRSPVIPTSFFSQKVMPSGKTALYLFVSSAAQFIFGAREGIRNTQQQQQQQQQQQKMLEGGGGETRNL